MHGLLLLIQSPLNSQKMSKTNIFFFPSSFFLPFLLRSSSPVPLSYPWSSSRPLTPRAITQHHKFPSAPSSLRPPPCPRMWCSSQKHSEYDRKTLEQFTSPFDLTHSFISLFSISYITLTFILVYPKSAHLRSHASFSIFHYQDVGLGATRPRRHHIYTPSKSSPASLASHAGREALLSYHEALLRSSNSRHEASPVSLFGMPPSSGIALNPHERFSALS